MMDSIFEKIQAVLGPLAKMDAPLRIAIDGRCSAGKTTIANRLQNVFECNALHMDDFFLRPEQRTEERLRQPGGNVDWERFREEVLFPLRCDVPFSYQPYDCHTQMLKEPVKVEPKRLTIVEGSYSCHPELWDFYNLHIFLTISSAEQRRRIQCRNGEAALKIFQNKWIPLEERYFEAFQIEQRCEFCFQNE